VRRGLVLVCVLLCATAQVASVHAQDQMPTELWSEYPLVQKVERVQPTSIGPLLPPSPAETSPSSDSTRWSLWLAAAAVGALAVLLALRTAVPVVSSGLRLRPRPRAEKPKPVQLREHPTRPRAPARRRQAQYAPLPPVAVSEPEIEREPRRSVVRRTGFLRSRFVVLSDEPGGNVKRVASSRSFWRVGSAAGRERAAGDAWNELIDDLRVEGWEPDSTRPSSFYVLLRRVDTAPSSILPTIEAYTRADPER
jgi:hypothetical protein